MEIARLIGEYEVDCPECKSVFNFRIRRVRRNSQPQEDTVVIEHLSCPVCAAVIPEYAVNRIPR